MSLPFIPSTSGLKPSELHIYTVEECQNCAQRTRRDYRVGDYVLAEEGTCEECNGKKIVSLIYGEKALKG